MTVADIVPKFDITRGCRTDSTDAYDLNVGQNETVKKCVADEQQALTQLETQWSQFREPDKAQCKETASIGGTPSYVDLLTCLSLSPLRSGRRPSHICHLETMNRPQKITLAEMRSSGVHGVLIYCQDFHCSHSIAISADQWPDHVRLSDLEARFVCKACGKRGADVRPDFNWNKQPVAESCSRSPLGENLSCFLQSLELFSALNS